MTSESINQVCARLDIDFASDVSFPVTLKMIDKAIVCVLLVTVYQHFGYPVSP
jgi:hypothetical protein